MTEIDSFGTFRVEVAAPSPEARRAARDRLVASFDMPANRRPGPRRLGAALAAGAALVAGALVVMALLDRPSVVERAEAAIDPQGRILHTVVSIEERDGSVTRGESWVRPDGSGRSLSSGTNQADCLANPAELRCYDAARNVVDVYRYYPEVVRGARRYADLPGFRVDQPASIHRAFSQGYAKLIGEVEIAGRAVYEIQLATPFIHPDGSATPLFDHALNPILYLDRETYYPVAQRFPDAGSTTTYETYEFVPDDAASRKLLELPTNATTRLVVHPVGEGPQS